MSQGNQGGMPHLAYFSGEYSISFVWSGRPGEPIEVCPGGYGEPVVEKIDTPHALREASYPLRYWLAWFQGECQHWLNRNLAGFNEVELQAMLDEFRKDDDD